MAKEIGLAAEFEEEHKNRRTSTEWR